LFPKGKIAKYFILLCWSTAAPPTAAALLCCRCCATAAAAENNCWLQKKTQKKSPRLDFTLGIGRAQRKKRHKKHFEKK
jgi:hypothetical protein